MQGSWNSSGDTDFSKAFKALCRSSVDSLRSAGQMELLRSGSREPWRASVTDFVKSVVSAQTEMQKRNLEKDWVLAGLRRNGMLAYQPDYTSLASCAHLLTKSCSLSR